jgi:hypothetical protein
VPPLGYGTAVARLDVGKEKGEERKMKEKKERRKGNRKNGLSIFRNCDL